MATVNLYKEGREGYVVSVLDTDGGIVVSESGRTLITNNKGGLNVTMKLPKGWRFKRAVQREEGV